MTDALADSVMARVETTKAKGSEYDSIVVDRRSGKVTFTATETLSKGEKEVIASHYNAKMQYDGFAVNNAGQLVLSLTKGKDIGSVKKLHEAVEAALEALKDPKAVNQTVNTAQNSAGSPLATALQLGKTKEAGKILDKDLSVDEKARSFQIAFNQGNLAMMAMLTEAGSFRPSPEMKNDKGVPLKQWLSDQARGGDEATRQLLAQVERKIEAPSITLSSRALAQVNAITLDANMWGMGGISSSSLVLPPAPQRSAALTAA